MRHNLGNLILVMILIMLSSALVGTDLRTIRLQLKWKHQFQFAGYYAAVEKGYYRDVGFDVKLLELDDTETPFDAVTSGKAEFGTSTTDIILARSAGKKVVVLASIFQHSPHVWITLKKSGIFYAQDLVGKRIAVEPGAAELYAFLIAEGVALNRCFIEDYDFNINNLSNGKLDAISAYSTDEPYFFAQNGEAVNTLYPSSAGIDFYGDLLFTSEDMIKKEPQVVKKFRAASLKGWSYAMRHPEEIVRLIYYKYDKRHSLEHLRFEANQMQKLILPDVVEIGYTNPGRWEAILTQYKKLGRVDKSSTIEGLLYADYDKHGVKIPWNIIIIFSIALIIAFSFLYIFYRSSKSLRKEILKRENIQKELAVSEALYRSILRASPDNITVTDLHGVIRIVSKAALQMLGCDMECEIIGRNVSEFTHPDDLERVKKRSARMLEGILNEPEEYRLLRKDGTIIDTELNAEIIKDANGNNSGIVMVVRNIQERKQRDAEIKLKNAELTKTNAEKDKFFSIISHDLRSPFHTFLGLTQLLLEDIGSFDQNKIQHFAVILNKSAARLYRLLENLLEWSRVERGLIVPKPSEFSINTAIEDILKMFKDSTQLKNQTIVTGLSKDVMAFADYQMTETILRNLLSNAAKFTPKGGTITISTSQLTEEFVKITITDTGIGMNKDILDNLFRIDANINRPGTEGESSTGLGLLLCKEFIELNEGTFSISSLEGKGSEFSFTLKIA